MVCPDGVRHAPGGLGDKPAKPCPVHVSCWPHVDDTMVVHSDQCDAIRQETNVDDVPIMPTIDGLVHDIGVLDLQ